MAEQEGQADGAMREPCLPDGLVAIASPICPGADADVFRYLQGPADEAAGYCVSASIRVE